MFITYFIQPWGYYNIGEEGCQEVNEILVTDCYFLDIEVGIEVKMWIFEHLVVVCLDCEQIMNFL